MSEEQEKRVEKKKVKLRRISSKTIEIKKVAIKSGQIERKKKEVTRFVKLGTEESKNTKNYRKK